MFNSTALPLVTKGILDDDNAVGLATKGVLLADVELASGCTIIPRSLISKGILPCSTSDPALALATKGILCCPIVIIEDPDDPDEPTTFRQTGGGGSSGKSFDWKPLKKIKVTVLMSGTTSTQEIVIDPGLSAKAQVLDILELPENTIFVNVKRS